MKKKSKGRRKSDQKRDYNYARIDKFHTRLIPLDWKPPKRRKK